MAEAVDTFDRWAGAAKRTDPEIMERGREVVKQFKFISFSDTVLALPSPRSGSIRRNPSDLGGIQQDMKNAGDEALRRRDAKKLTPAEYDDEMAIIGRWAKAMSGVQGGR
jgi:hypothetical protein